MQFTKQQLCAVLCLVIQSCASLSNTMDCMPPGSSVRGDSPGRNTGVCCHPLLQGIFPTQGLKPNLPHCRKSLYRLNHQGSSAAVIAIVILYKDFPGGSEGKASVYNAGDPGLRIFLGSFNHQMPTSLYL